jgi:3-keto-5-aminohexanoate cleavage enzyme
MVFVRGEPAEKLIVQLAPTGMQPQKYDNPHVPISPAEIIQDTETAYKLGASVVHLHAREPDGSPSYRKEVFREIFSGIRAKCPEIIICASTSGRIFRRLEQRMEVLDLQPEMASLALGTVNFHYCPSYNTLDEVVSLAKAMRDRGVRPELEIFEPGFINTAKYLAKKGIIKEPMQFNLLLGSLASIPADMRDISYLVDSIPSDSVWMATGIGRFQLQVNVAAIIMGGHVRVGLEDNIFYDCARKECATNAMLVERIVRVAKELGREIASPKEARRILGFPEA